VTLVQGGMTLLAPAAPSEQAPGPSPEVFSIRPSAPAAFGFRWQRVAIAVLLAAVVGAGSYFYGRSSTERARDALRSIAVLPFATGGPNSGEGTDYIAFSLTEAVTYELAQLDGFRVASTASVRGSRESGKSLAEIAKLLGVGAVLDGSIIQDGSRVVVTVQLVEAAADERLWTGGYTRDSMSLTTQKEIAQHICRHVWQTLVPIGKAMVLQQPAGLTAYSRATVR
jgi:TolB-like protein